MFGNWFPWVLLLALALWAVTFQPERNQGEDR